MENNLPLKIRNEAEGKGDIIEIVLIKCLREKDLVGKFEAEVELYKDHSYKKEIKCEICKQTIELNNNSTKTIDLNKSFGVLIYFFCPLWPFAIFLAIANLTGTEVTEFLVFASILTGTILLLFPMFLIVIMIKTGFWFTFKKGVEIERKVIIKGRRHSAIQQKIIKIITP